MKEVIIIGAGGQCRAVLGILDTVTSVPPKAVYDIGTPKNGEFIMGVPVLPMPAREELRAADNLYILAIGDNATRKQYYEELRSLGCTFFSLVSPYARISKEVSIGEACVIAPHVFIGPLSRIGSNVLLNTASVIEHDSVVGDHCHLAPSSVMCGRTEMGDTCFLGANATIIDKRKIAANTVIGAGGVVNRDIVDMGGTWIGVPVKRLSR